MALVTKTVMRQARQWQQDMRKAFDGVKGDIADVNARMGGGLREPHPRTKGDLGALGISIASLHKEGSELVRRRGCTYGIFGSLVVTQQPPPLDHDVSSLVPLGKFSLMIQVVLKLIMECRGVHAGLPPPRHGCRARDLAARRVLSAFGTGAATPSAPPRVEREPAPFSSYRNRFDEVRMREVAMVSPAAAVHEPGAFQLGDQFPNLRRHAAALQSEKKNGRRSAAGTKRAARR